MTNVFSGGNSHIIYHMPVDFKRLVIVIITPIAFSHPWRRQTDPTHSQF
jgi:hypothetical protein